MSYDTKHTTPPTTGWTARHRRLLAILVGAVAVADGGGLTRVPAATGCQHQCSTQDGCQELALPSHLPPPNEVSPATQSRVTWSESRCTAARPP
jgi:hypothetical protein